MDSSQATKDEYSVHWPEPPHLTFAGTSEHQAEPCEIEFLNGKKEIGAVLSFNAREDNFLFTPHADHKLSGERIVVKLANVKQVRLTNAVSIAQAQSSDVQVYNVEFEDGEITSGETSGYVRLPSGLFLYFLGAGSRLTRAFIPEGAISYCQIGDPMEKLLVEENLVSEEKMKEAVEKQQEMRKLVLGDYLIEQGYITSAQLEKALEFQKERPKLRLGEALIEMGVLTSEALQSALERQRANRGRPLSQILMDMGAVDANALKKVHAKQLGLPFVSLSNARIDAEAVRLLPAATAHRLQVLPLAVEDGALIVAMEDQPTSEALSELGLVARMRIVPVIAAGDELVAKQREAYGSALPQLIADPSAIRFAAAPPAADDSAQVDALFASDGDIDLSDPQTSHSDRVLAQAVAKLVASTMKGGELYIDVDNSGGTRRTQIRFRKG